jgi:ATP-binding cassette subfamily B (MDR/TAP) protein 1
MTIISGGVYPAVALLFSFGLIAFMSPDLVYMRSRINLLGAMWLVVSIAEGFACAFYVWSFGLCSERMVRRVRLSSFQAILRQNAAFFDRDDHSSGTLTQMLGQEATAMSGLSGQNLGAILTVLFGLISSAIVALSFAWKLALVALTCLPVLIVTAFMQMRLMDHLQDHLRDAYGNSAALATEQIAAIRTVASLRRENALHAEFCDSLDAPVRKAMISTIKSTLVGPFDF